MRAEGRRVAGHILFGLTLLSIGASVAVSCSHSLAQEAIVGQKPPSSGDIGTIGGNLPIAFEPNLGQSAAPVRFLGRADGYQLFITNGESVIALNSVESPQPKGQMASLGTTLEEPRAIRIKLLDAALSQKIDGSDAPPGRINYLIGRNPADWHTNIPTYRTVTQHGVWPGIDLVYYGDPDRRIESDFVVAPGSDPQLIRLAFTGSDGLSIDPDGNLVIAVGHRVVTMLKPEIYQRLAGHRLAVDGRYVIDEASATASKGQRVRFEIAPYDHRQTLVIDPKISLVYSTYLGGSGFDTALAIAIGRTGRAFVAGYTKSADFPATHGHLRESEDAFVAKFSADGKSLIYATFIGGTSASGYSRATAIVVDSDGNAYITGVADTKNFPTTPHVLQPDAPAAGGHPFVSKLTVDGQSFVYSTYMGSHGTKKCSGSDIGVDWATGIKIDPNAEPFITGVTCDGSFPLVRPFQLSDNVDFPSAFVAHLTRDGRGLFFSTYLGGNGLTEATSIALDPNLVVPDIYVTGTTSARNFPIKNAFQPHRHGYSDVFITRFHSDGTSLVYSTFLGGDNGDEGRAIAIDTNKHAYVVGNYASLNFPITHVLASYGEEIVPGIFIAKVAGDGKSLLYCDALGEFGDISANAIAVSDDQAYITGTLKVQSFPMVNAFQDTPQGGTDVFVSKISRDGNSLSDSTYLGGTGDDEGNAIAIGPDGDVYVAGETTSHNFPLVNPFQSTLPAHASAFLARLHMP